jgi:hypothetical protein
MGGSSLKLFCEAVFQMILKFVLRSGMPAWRQTAVRRWHTYSLVVFANSSCRHRFVYYFTSRKYTAKETIAPPKHIPVPIRRTISTPRMFVQAGLLSMAKRFMTPKKVSKKKMRGNLRLLFIDCPFNCSSDSRFIIQYSFACA